jgi:hypothetical protein
VNYSSLELKQNSFDAIIVSGFKVWTLIRLCY